MEVNLEGFHGGCAAKNLHACMSMRVDFSIFLFSNYFINVTNTKNILNIP
jgi:hypothetical protein